jgi:hypothetical protein
MKQPPPELLTLMTLAAGLRAAGGSWDAVAEKVGRRPRTCRDWPLSYPEVWQRLYLAAEDRLLEEAGAEALHFLRRLARDAPDPWVRQNTAKFLYERRCEARAHLRATAAAAPAGDWGPFVAYLEGLTDGELKAFLQDFVARRLAEAGPAVPADGGGASTAVAG